MTINAKLGDANQNSYVELSQANTYFSNRRGTTSWDNLNATNKEVVLIQAARDIDRFRFLGDKYYDSQGLKFPRDDHEVVTGNCSTPVTATSFKNAGLYSTVYNEMPEDYWKYGSVHITSGTPIRETRKIISSSASDGKVVASPAFSSAVTTNSAFIVFKPIYKEVQNAQCEQALYLVNSSGMDTLLNYKNLGAESIKIGDTSVSFRINDLSKSNISSTSKKLLLRFIDKNLRVQRA